MAYGELNMGPVLSSNNVADCTSVNPVLICNLGLGDAPSGVALAYAQNVGIGKFISVVIFAMLSVPPTLPFHIAGIMKVGAEKHMIGIDALRSIATVTDEHAIRYFAEDVPIEYAVRDPTALAIKEESVPASDLAASPYPAAIGLGYLGKETPHYVFGIHGLVLIMSLTPKYTK